MHAVELYNLIVTSNFKLHSFNERLVLDMKRFLKQYFMILHYSLRYRRDTSSLVFHLWCCQKACSTDDVTTEGGGGIACAGDL